MLLSRSMREFNDDPTVSLRRRATPASSRTGSLFSDSLWWRAFGEMWEEIGRLEVVGAAAYACSCHRGTVDRVVAMVRA